MTRKVDKHYIRNNQHNVQVLLNKLFRGDSMEYTTEIIELKGSDGKVSQIISCHPILDEDESERIRVEALKVIDRILKKHNFK